jgi:hypothetical protein
MISLNSLDLKSSAFQNLSKAGINLVYSSSIVAICIAVGNESLED